MLGEIEHGSIVRRVKNNSASLVTFVSPTVSMLDCVPDDFSGPEVLGSHVESCESPPPGDSQSSADLLIRFRSWFYLRNKINDSEINCLFTVS